MLSEVKRAEGFHPVGRNDDMASDRRALFRRYEILLLAIEIRSVASSAVSSTCKSHFAPGSKEEKLHGINVISTRPDIQERRPRGEEETPCLYDLRQTFIPEDLRNVRRAH